MIPKLLVLTLDLKPEILDDKMNQIINKKMSINTSEIPILVIQFYKEKWRYIIIYTFALLLTNYYFTTKYTLFATIVYLAVAVLVGSMGCYFVLKKQSAISIYSTGLSFYSILLYGVGRFKIGLICGFFYLPTQKVFFAPSGYETKGEFLTNASLSLLTVAIFYMFAVSLFGTVLPATIADTKKSLSAAANRSNNLFLQCFKLQFYTFMSVTIVSITLFLATVAIYSGAYYANFFEVSGSHTATLTSMPFVGLVFATYFSMVQVFLIVAEATILSKVYVVSGNPEGIGIANPFAAF